MVYFFWKPILQPFFTLPSSRAIFLAHFLMQLYARVRTYEVVLRKVMQNFSVLAGNHSQIELSADLLFFPQHYLPTYIHTYITPFRGGDVCMYVCR